MRAIMASVLLLLVTATSASSECAWVMWAQEGSKPWNPMEAYSTKEACDNDLKKRMEYASSLKGVTTSGNYAIIGSILITHSCFPDTLDPRAPKGR